MKEGTRVRYSGGFFERFKTTASDGRSQPFWRQRRGTVQDMVDERFVPVVWDDMPGRVISVLPAEIEIDTPTANVTALTPHADRWAELEREIAALKGRLAALEWAVSAASAKLTPFLDSLDDWMQ